MNAAELFAEKQTYLDQFHASGYPAAFEDYQSQVKAFFDACDSTCPAEEKNIEDFCKEIAGQISSCAAEQKKQAMAEASAAEKSVTKEKKRRGRETVICLWLLMYSRQFWNAGTATISRWSKRLKRHGRKPLKAVR